MCRLKKLIIVLVLFPVTLYSAYSLTILFHDDFEDPLDLDGNFPAHPIGDNNPLWIGPEEQVASSYNIEVHVDGALAHNGTKTLYMNKNDQAGNWIRSRATFNASVQQYIYIDYWVRVATDIPPTYACAIIKYVDGGGKTAAMVSFNDSDPGETEADDDHVFYYSSATKVDSVWVYTLDVWYHVRIVADQIAKTFTLYIDDFSLPVVANAPYYDLTAGNITEIWFELEATAPNVYFDQISVFENDSAPGPDTTPPLDAAVNSSDPLVSIDNPTIDVDFYDNPGGNLDEVRYSIGTNDFEGFTHVIATNISGESYTANWQIDQAAWDALAPGDSLTVYFLLIDDGSNYTISSSNITLRKHGYARQKADVTVLNNVINPEKGEMATVRVNQTRAGNLSVIVFDLGGNIVNVLFNGFQSSGVTSYNWDGRNRADDVVASGVYFIRIVGPDIDEYRKVLVVK